MRCLTFWFLWSFCFPSLILLDMWKHGLGLVRDMSDCSNKPLEKHRLCRHLFQFSQSSEGQSKRSHSVAIWDTRHVTFSFSCYCQFKDSSGGCARCFVLTHRGYCQSKKKDHDGHLACTICHAQGIVMWHTQIEVSWDVIVAYFSLSGFGR